MTELTCVLLDDSFEDHVLHHLHRLETMMTSFSSDQAHLDADVAAETAAVSDVQAAVDALKAQIAANPTAPVVSLDLSKFDALVQSTQADATTDTPPAPAPAPAPAAPADPTPAPAAPVATDPSAPAAPVTPPSA